MKKHKKTREEHIAEPTELPQPLEQQGDSSVSPIQTGRSPGAGKEILRAIMDATHESLVVIDREGTVLLSNTVGAQRLGKDVEDFVGTCLYEHFPPEVAQSRKEHYDKTFATGKPVYFEDFRLERSFKQYCYPVLDEEGVTVKAAVFAHEVTERKHAESELRLHGEILENMAEGVNLIQTGDGTIVYVNPTFERIFGYDPGELAGKHVSILNAATEKIPEETAREIMQSLHERGVWSGDIRTIGKDGTVFWCRTRASSFDHPRYGKVWLGICEDITERKQAEEALKDSESRYRLLAENVSDVIWTMDMDLHFTYISPSITRFRGIAADQALHQPLKDVVTPSSYAVVQGILEEELAKESMEQRDPSRSRVVELEHIRNDGSTGWAEVRVSFLRDTNGQPNGILGVTRDITHRKEAEQELRMKSLNLEEVNTALKVLLEQREKDKDELEDKILFNVRKLILPYIERLKQRQLDDEQKTYLDVLETNLKNIISPFATRLTSVYAGFTPLEIRVADFIRDGKTAKEVARTLGVSESAINLHRQHIRNKLGLNNQKINLRTHLLSLA